MFGWLLLMGKGPKGLGIVSNSSFCLAATSGNIPTGSVSKGPGACLLSIPTKSVIIGLKINRIQVMYHSFPWVNKVNSFIINNGSTWIQTI